MVSTNTNCAVLLSFRWGNMRPCVMPKSAQESAQTVDRGGEERPPPGCDVCGRAMQHIATLPETPRFSMQHFYRCLECRTVAKIEVH
jgi:hypothetical protein